jgi:succinate dehydrogenase/fumarate reductase flavoprotein subunit
MTITYALMEKLEDMAVSHPSKVRILKKADVKKLVKDASGNVVGVEFMHNGSQHKEMGPVVIATGGYAADFTSDSLLKKYRPELWDLPTV